MNDHKQPERIKKAYHPPKLKKLGTVDELTQGQLAYSFQEGTYEEFTTQP